MLGRWKKNGPEVPQVDFHSRLDFQFVSEFGIQAGASGGQRLKDPGRLEGTVDEHSSCSVGGFAAGLSALDDQDGGAALPQRDREREADDPSADDDYVPSLHVGIVKEEQVPGVAGSERR